jgi:hypothetical protein
VGREGVVDMLQAVGKYRQWLAPGAALVVGQAAGEVMEGEECKEEGGEEKRNRYDRTRGGRWRGWMGIVVRLVMSR